MNFIKRESEIEIIPYPKEQIEHMVDQIIKIHDSKHKDYGYTVELEKTIEILNEGLRLLVKPLLIVKGDNRG